MTSGMQEVVSNVPTCSVTEHIKVRLEVQLIDEKAKLPFRKRITDAGYDLYSIHDIELLPGRATLVRTGIKISCPPGFYYTIEGRSSLWMKGIFPNRGIIDATYTGEVIVSLVNVTDSVFPIKEGNRIAQMILHRQYDADFEIVHEFSSTYDQRGTDGFGSSGK